MIANACYLYDFWPSPVIKSIFGVFILSITFFIPLIILIYCYGRIVWVMTRRIDSKLNTSGPNVDTFHVARTHTIKTLLTVALCFVICWSTNQIYYLMYNLGYEVDWNSTYFNFTVLMTFLNSTINPFIYLIKYRDFQEALRFCSPQKLNSQQSSIFTASSDISS